MARTNLYIYRYIYANGTMNKSFYIFFDKWGKTLQLNIRVSGSKITILLLFKSPESTY